MKRVHVVLASLLVATTITSIASAQGPEASRITVGESGSSVTFWLDSSLVRVFPGRKGAEPQELDLIAPRNGRVSFQVAVRSERIQPARVRCDVTGDPDLTVRVRRVGQVPMGHHTADIPVEHLDGIGHIPGLVPDVLFNEQDIASGPQETQSFWITVSVPADATPGLRKLQVDLKLDGKTHTLVAPMEIAELTLKRRENFPVTHWFRVEAIWDWHKTGMWEDERLWTLLDAYLKNYADHDNDLISVPLLFDRREIFKRPAQALIVEQPEAGKFTFDWRHAQRFVDLAKRCGIDRFEWPHFWLYWGAETPVNVYAWKNGQAEVIWPAGTKARDEVFLAFLRQFLPELKTFLQRNDILDKSYFHLSDEPHGSEQHLANYRANRNVLRELAPWMKVMDALSDVRYGREGLTDIPIPLVDSAQAYIDERIPHWVYYCCVPRGKWLNRFLDTPLTDVRMSGWLFYRLNAQGFLHWGYNYWHFMESERITDPFHMHTGGDWPNIPHGDPFVVYPGPDGPLDSIRWEVFAESLQDYAILQTLGVKPDDARLAALRSYQDFPREAKWIDNLRRQLLTTDVKSAATGSSTKAP